MKTGVLYDTADGLEMWLQSGARAARCASICSRMNSTFQQGGDAECRQDTMTRQCKGAPTFEPKAAPDAGTAEGGAKP